ncbi:MAG: hypothetical protein RIB55_06780 [Nitratireductor sp.]
MLVFPPGGDRLSWELRYRSRVKVECQKDDSSVTPHRDMTDPPRKSSGGRVATQKLAALRQG